MTEPEQRWPALRLPYLVLAAAAGVAGHHHDEPARASQPGHTLRRLSWVRLIRDRLSWGQLSRVLARPTDTSALVAFRVLFGLLVFVSAVRFIAYGWVERFFVRPQFMFKYWGFSWVRVWPEWGMYLHLIVLAVLGLCVAAGIYYRLTSWLLFLCFGYLQLIDASLYLNHYYLITLLAGLTLVLPLGSAGSFDARRKPEQRRTSFPAWCTYLLRIQVGLVYFYAGLAKLSGDWLIHAQPLNIWLHGRAEMPLIGGLFEHWWFALALSWAGFLFDISIVAWLSWRRARPIAYAVLLFFHLMTHLLFNIGMFPLIMSACALVFFEPDWPRRVWSKLGQWLPWGQADSGPTAGEPPLSGDNETAANAAPSVVQHMSGWRRLGFAALGLYLLVQVLMPLRHYLYPGDVLWNEQGMRWSWKVKVRAKNGAVSYYVKRPDGRRHIVSPRRYLADYQEREMSGQPDLILQLAHYIGREYNAKGQGPVEVRADAVVSLNGRPSAPMIDRTVDLMKVDDGLAVAHWVLPEPATDPIHLGRRTR